MSFLSSYFTPSVNTPIVPLVGVETNPGPEEFKIQAKSGKVKRKRQRRSRGGEVVKSFSLLSGSVPAGMNFISTNRPYRFTQSVEGLSVLSSSTTVPAFVTAYFTIGQVDQVTSLAAVFDQYRIDLIEYWLFPRNLNGGAAGSNNGLLLSVVDYDDATNLSTLAQASDYSNCLTTSGNIGHYRRFIPHCATAAYSGAFTSYANQGPMWIDFVSTSVQHYGVKLAVSATSAIQVYDANIRFHVSCRNVR